MKGSESGAGRAETIRSGAGCDGDGAGEDAGNGATDGTDGEDESGAGVDEEGTGRAAAFRSGAGDG